MDVLKISEKKFTIDDMIDLPEGVHMEMIEGKVYDMATPSPRHQEIVAYFVRRIGDHIEKKKGDCIVYPAPFAVFLSNDEDTYLEPDVSVICDKSKISDRGCEGAPDWIIEVVSPSTKSMDYLRKLNKYMQKGVRLYWIVDPISAIVSVYNFTTDTVEQYSFKDTIPVAIYEDLEIDMAGMQ